MMCQSRHVMAASPRKWKQPFWCLFFPPSFICGSHPSLLRRFWHAIRRHSRRSWLRRRLKAQPIWTLFPRRCLFWIIILWARRTLLISLTPALVFRSLPPTPAATATASVSLSSFFSLQSQIIFQGWWGNCVANPAEVRFATKGGGSLFRGRRWSVPASGRFVLFFFSRGEGGALPKWCKSPPYRRPHPSRWGKSTFKGINMFDLFQGSKERWKNHQVMQRVCHSQLPLPKK